MSNTTSIIRDKKARISLYKKDMIAYALVLLSVAAEFVYVVNVLDAMPISFWMGVTVMVNIFLLFLLFTCAVKVSAYRRAWALVSMAAGVYMLVRQFVLVPLVLRPTGGHTVILLSNLAGAALLLAAGYLNLDHIRQRDKVRG